MPGAVLQALFQQSFVTMQMDKAQIWAGSA
jgi:hypothetical protein